MQVKFMVTFLELNYEKAIMLKSNLNEKKK
jgi:hypothetical protein